MLKPEDNEYIKSYLTKRERAKISYPFSRTLAVFSVDNIPFAYLETGKQLPRLSLRSDPLLAKVLREKYEEVGPGEKLDTRIWSTIVLSGQLSVEEITALIDHSYQLAQAA